MLASYFLPNHSLFEAKTAKIQSQKDKIKTQKKKSKKDLVYSKIVRNFASLLRITPRGAKENR